MASCGRDAQGTLPALISKAVSIHRAEGSGVSHLIGAARPVDPVGEAWKEPKLWSTQASCLTYPMMSRL